MASRFDESWLNDRSEFQRNFVHGMRNPIGLRIQYRLEGERAVGEWTPDDRHVGFPGFVHGGLVGAVLDDVMGRMPALLHRWVVTARQQTRFRTAAPIGATLRVEGWIERETRRMLLARARAAVAGGETVAEAEGTYLPIPPELRDRMVESWPGFARYI